jgi:hypothetical protein
MRKMKSFHELCLPRRTDAPYPTGGATCRARSVPQLGRRRARARIRRPRDRKSAMAGRMPPRRQDGKEKRTGLTRAREPVRTQSTAAGKATGKDAHPGRGRGGRCRSGCLAAAGSESPKVIPPSIPGPSQRRKGSRNAMPDAGGL